MYLTAKNGVEWFTYWGLKSKINGKVVSVFGGSPMLFATRALARKEAMVDEVVIKLSVKIDTEE